VNAATAIALVILIGAWALHLDRSAFDAGEATTAATALGPLDHEARVPTSTPAHALIRGFGVAITTTERGLRLLFALGLLLAALVVGEAAARMVGAYGRPLVWLIFATHPFMARTDLLYPGLLAPLPLALMLGGGVYLRGGSRWWAASAVLGAAAAAILTLPAQLAAALTVFGLPLLLRSRPVGHRARLAALQVAVFLGAWLSAGCPVDVGPALDGEPGVAALLGIGGAAPLVGDGALVPLVLFGGAAWGLLCVGGRRATIYACAALAIIAVVGSAPRGAGGGWGEGSGLAALLPGAALGLCWALTRDGRLAKVAGCVLIVVALVGMARLAPTWRGEKPGRLNQLLDRARTHATPGGRLVLWGADRHALLYYMRRGHDPGIPVILIDEDSSMDQLADLLRQQLRAEAGREHLLPTVLIHPRAAPAGTELLPVDWADDQLAAIRIKRP